MKRVLAATLLLVAVGTASAQETNYSWTIPGGFLAVPDNNPTGVFVDLAVTDNIPFGADPYNCVEVTLAMKNTATGTLGHSWAGDLVITLTKVGDGSSFLVNRIGRIVPPGTSFGDSSDFKGPYTFTNGKPPPTPGDIWTAAAAAASTANIPAGPYRASSSSAVVGSVPPLDLCAPFLAAGSAGIWRLSISDNAAGDTGGLESATLTLKPEPATLSLLGLGALALIRRRR